MHLKRVTHRLFEGVETDKLFTDRTSTNDTQRPAHNKLIVDSMAGKERDVGTGLAVRQRQISLPSSSIAAKAFTGTLKNLTTKTGNGIKSPDGDGRKLLMHFLRHRNLSIKF